MTEKLKEIYANHAGTERYYETLEVSSPAWATGVKYLVNETDEIDKKLENGNVVKYLPYPFAVKVPDIGASQQDLSIQLDSTYIELILALEQATTQNAPIVLKYRVYAEKSDEVQMTAIRLNVTSVQLKNNTVSLTCTRPDLFKRMFPTGDRAIFDNRFSGLNV